MVATFVLVLSLLFYELLNCIHDNDRLTGTLGMDAWHVTGAEFGELVCTAIGSRL
jgi:hypothetical protein